MFQSPRRLRLSALCLLIVFFATSPSVASAAEPLAWKFTPGAKNRYRTTQDITVVMDLGPGGKQTQHIVNVVDLSWIVFEASADQVLLSERIDRIRLTIALNDQPPLEYDTASPIEPVGFAAMVAPALKELTRSEFKITMTPTGKITKVGAPETLLAALKAAPGAQAMGNLATPTGLEQMIRNSWFELPADSASVAQWSVNSETEKPILGTETLRIIYKNAGQKEVNGVVYEAFKPDLNIEFMSVRGDPPTNIEVTKQESQGEVLFTRDEGRLESIVMEHTLELNAISPGKSLQQSIHQKFETKWLAPDAE